LIEIDLTPNRADCLSVRGVAREVAVLNGLKVQEPSIEPVVSQHDRVFPVQLKAAEACPKYIGRVIEGVDVSAPSPLWLQEKLRRSGVRSIDAIVDVTNFVLLELGQPMHAFDLDKLKGGIVVRMAEPGETLKLLDEQEVSLAENTLVIADHESALAMAGIMGGQASSVTASTVNILLESAFFNPLAITGRARSHGLHTDSSHRFERGVDFCLQELAIERASKLIVDIAGGKPGPVHVCVAQAHLPSTKKVALRKASVERYLKLDLGDEVIEGMMLSLGLELDDKTADGWQFKVPSWRFDIAIEVDLLEEIARIYGYNRLPTQHPQASLVLKPDSEQDFSTDKLRQHMLAEGYNEVITYSFVDPELQSLFSEVDPVSLLNPIASDLSEMRLSLIPGLLKTAQYNLNRQQHTMRLFETGLRFIRQGDQTIQQPMLSALLTGLDGENDWAKQDRPFDFFDMKGDLENLLSIAGRKGHFHFEPAELKGYHPGQTAIVSFSGAHDESAAEVGFIGAIHPAIQSRLGFSRPLFVFELSLASLLSVALPVFAPLSKYPEVSRDLAFIVDKSVQAGQMCKIVQEKAGAYLVNLKVFDVYSGEGIDPHRKSIGFGLTFQHKSRTLTESEINSLIDDIVHELSSQFGAELRN
ncbi:MAG: phenylalanine--tRNA ligase subunit beta, partial [Pseudomonadales bacterium]|nr:phenylalanine--tRNA ligase subunit beta [Pseudomonadales bacterium]